MKAKPEETQTPTPRITTAPKRAMLDVPDQLPKEFGVQCADYAVVQGVVETKNIPQLLSAFGAGELSQFHFPYQKFGVNKTGRTSIRIEQQAGHTVEGTPVSGHQWMWRQESPELSS